MMQDKLGFMWFGTRDGLNRFDGLSYKIFRNNPMDSTSIGNNAILSLAEDTNQQIWVGTEKGLYVFDEMTEEFSPIKTAGSSAIQSVKISGGLVFFINMYVVYSYNPQTKQLTSYNFPNEVTSFSVSDEGGLWVATANGWVARYNKTKKLFDQPFDVFSSSKPVVSRSIQSLCDIGSGRFLVGTSNEGLKLLDTQKRSYENLITHNTDQTDITVMDILQTDTDLYWVASQSGIYIINIATKEYHHVQKKYEDPYSLSDNIVQSLFRDEQGGVWASTYFGGVNYFSLQQMAFKKYFPKATGTSISGYAVGEIRQDKYDKLWIATENAGLNKLDLSTGAFTNFNPTDKKETISYFNVQSLLVHADSLWAGTFLHGLDLLDLNGRRIRNYNTLDHSIGSNYIDALIYTRSRRVMAATDKGAFLYDAAKDVFEPVTALPRAFFRALRQDHKGYIWCGTYGSGFYKYDAEKNTAKQYFFAINGNRSIACNIINYIHCSGDLVWFATEGGLCRFNTRTSKVTIFTTKDDLPANVIYTILEDEQQNLWLSTSKGLVRFSPGSNTVKVYTRSKGLLTDQFNYRSAFKDKVGRMYFGSVKGLVSFHPDSIPVADYSAPVYITGFQIYNKEITINKKNSPLSASILYTKALTLPYDQSTFSIDFAALDYNAPSSIRYAYKMEGLDNIWNYLPSNRKAYFTELPPGKYTFVVKALTDPDVSAEKFARLHIEILPPVWATWQAYFMYVLLIASIAFLVIRFFYNRSKERNKRRLEKMAFEKEKEHYEDKIDFFTNVAHEIKTPLTLIKGPMENIMDEVDGSSPISKNLDLMSRNADRLMLLANQILDFRKIEMNGFHLTFERLDISELLRDISARFIPVAANHQLRYEIDVPENITALADEEALNKIFNNLIDNAIKYAHAFVSIRLSKVDQLPQYEIRFINDGFVIPPEDREKIFESFYRIKDTAGQAGTGIGLVLSRALAEMHSGSLIVDESQQDKNVFVLRLPFSPKTETT